jgi:alpha-L-rhamnosidase
MPAAAKLSCGLCTLALAVGALGGAPLPARRLRAGGSNTHVAVATSGTNYAIDAVSTFSWAASHEDRGASQTAFRLRVIDPATGRTVHDSGRVESAHPTYELAPEEQGRRLPGGRTYAWSVTWFDHDGQASPPSEPASFHLGLSDPGDWAGVPWLGSNTTNLYRTEASVGGSPSKTLAAATLYICALGYGKVTVGGKPASDGLMAVSGWTNNERMNYYETYDVSEHVRAARQSAALSRGQKISIGVALGHGWRDQSKFPRHDPKDAVGDKIDKVFRAQLKMTFTDGSTSTAVTTADPSWTTAAGPVTSDGVYDGETYDARLEQPGWDVVGFDDTQERGWSPAQAVTDGPRGAMVASAMPKVVIDSVRKPVQVTNLGDRYVIDFGSNVAGWTSIKNMKGKAGDTVVLKHAEVMQHEHLPDLKGKINTSRIYTGNLRTALATDTYILRGDPAGETYTPSFTYHGARYVEVTGFPGTLTAADVEYQHFHTGNSPKSSTKFSSPTITAIQRMAVGAQRSNMMTVPTDCDQRDERLGWMGDADLSAQTMLLNYDCGAFFTMFMKNMDSETDPDGSITDVVPLVRYGGRPADPSWSAALIEVAYQLYKIDGISAVAKAHWDKMLLHLEFYASAAAKSPTHWPKTKYGDWVPPPVCDT